MKVMMIFIGIQLPPKLGNDVGDALKDVAYERRDAGYKVASEKGDAFAGDARSTCVTASKSKYGKNSTSGWR